MRASSKPSLRELLNPYAQTSTLLLLVTNIILIIQAIAFNWDIGTMVWTYWLQGIVIIFIGLVVSPIKFGWVMLLGIMCFYGFFMAGLTFPSDSSTYVINGQQVRPEEFTVFMDTKWNAVLANTVLLGVNHIVSYALDGKKGKELRSMGRVVKRIIPLHLIIVLAIALPLPVLFFMVVKTIADIAAHNSQHAVQLHGKLPRHPRRA